MLSIVIQRFPSLQPKLRKKSHKQLKPRSICFPDLLNWWTITKNQVFCYRPPLRSASVLQKKWAHLSQHLSNVVLDPRSSEEIIHYKHTWQMLTVPRGHDISGCLFIKDLKHRKTPFPTICIRVKTYLIIGAK